MVAYSCGAGYDPAREGGVRWARSGPRGWNGRSRGTPAPSSRSGTGRCPACGSFLRGSAVNVVYASSGGYAEIAGISMRSLFESNRDVEELAVWMVDCGIGGENRRKLLSVAAEYGRALFFVHGVDPSERAGIPVAEGRWHPATFQRLPPRFPAAPGGGAGPLPRLRHPACAARSPRSGSGRSAPSWAPARRGRLPQRAVCRRAGPAPRRALRGQRRAAPRSGALAAGGDGGTVPCIFADARRRRDLRRRGGAQRHARRAGADGRAPPRFGAPTVLSGSPTAICSACEGPPTRPPRRSGARRWRTRRSCTSPPASIRGAVRGTRTARTPSRRSISRTRPPPPGGRSRRARMGAGRSAA